MLVFEKSPFIFRFASCQICMSFCREICPATVYLKVEQKNGKKHDSKYTTKRKVKGKNNITQIQRNECQSLSARAGVKADLIFNNDFIWILECNLKWFDCWLFVP